jgi:biotin carboxyl carrier protein
MNTTELKDVLAWIKSTDLVEVSFKAAGKGFTLATAEAPVRIPNAVFPSRYDCVASPAVGLFQGSALGKSKAEEGASVAAGDVLGLIDGGGKSKTEVKANASGRVAKVLVEAGGAVQYGQPLFLIEPR